MTHYRFIVRDGVEIDDPNGLVLANDNVAMGEAAHIIRKVKASGDLNFRGWSMDVCDGERLVGTLSFDQVD